MINGDSLGYYAALEVTPDVGAETIKQQYHELAKIWHPDRNTGDEAAEARKAMEERVRSVGYEVRIGRGDAPGFCGARG